MLPANTPAAPATATPPPLHDAMFSAPLICVCIKPVWRTEVALRLDADRRGVRSAEALRVANGADLAALGLALSLRAAEPALRILAVTVGPPADASVLREALAAGADAVLRVWGPGWPDDPGQVEGSAAGTQARAQAVAQALCARGPTLLPTLVLTGERSADTGAECFGGFLAHRLGAAFAHRVTAVRRDGAGWHVTVRLERGYGQSLALAAPAVLTVPAQLPRPGVAPLPAWLAAREAPIPVEAVDYAAAGTPEAGGRTGGRTGEAAASGETTLRIPVPRVRRYTVPGAELGAEGRIQAMTTFQAAGGGGVVRTHGTPQEHAQALAEFLRDRGYA